VGGAIMFQSENMLYKGCNSKEKKGKRENKCLKLKNEKIQKVA